MLQFKGTYGIIIERDCDRYALKREVAAERCRFFRGVCPILNRATDILSMRRAWVAIAPFCTQTFLPTPGYILQKMIRFFNAG